MVHSMKANGVLLSPRAQNIAQPRPVKPPSSPHNMGTAKKTKRAAASSPLPTLSRLSGDCIEFINSIPGKPVLFILCLVAANFQGHYVPFFWSFSSRPALIPSLVQSGELRTETPSSMSSLDHQQKHPELNKLNQDVTLESSRKADAITSEDVQGSDDMPHINGQDEHLGTQDRSEETSAGAGDDATSHLHSEQVSSGGDSSAAAGSAIINDRNNEPAEEGDTFTPYLNYHQIEVHNTPVCKGILPPDLLKNVNRNPITDLKTLDEMGRRALVFMPRYGLGNSLRGYVSAYVFARLSGRTLVRFHGAEHTKVYDTLCMAFKCGFDSIHWDNETTPMALYRSLDALNPFPMYKSSNGIRDSITEDVPVMICRSPSHFDGFWRNSARLQSCVYTAFSCSSTWCVHSRAIHGLLRGPTPSLKEVVRAILKKFVPGKDGQQDKEILAADETDERGAQKPMKGLVGMFDVALHMRTRTAAIESLDGGDAELSRVGCVEKGKKKPPHQFLKKCLWNCIEGILKELEKSRKMFWESKKKAGIELPPPPKLSILLTTDNEALRPSFVKKLSALGDVYFSSGGIVHLSKSSSSDLERLPTMAEFFLMAKSHTIIEAGSYVSTFAYFAALFGNGTLASIEWHKGGGCGLKLTHQGEIGRYYPEPKSRTS